jgi:uncharacterized protein (TIGR03435 family)
MRKSIATSLLLASCAVSAMSQKPAAKPREFDVASIKKIDGACPAGPPLGLTPGRILLHCVTARMLIRSAYSPLTTEDRTPLRAIGGPPWIDAVKYDLEAKADGATGTELMGPLLLSLLKDRFHLQTHTEPKDTPVYLLTVAEPDLNHRPGLKPADPNACVVRDLSAFPPPLQQIAQNICGTSQFRGTPEMRNIDSYSVDIDSFLTVLSSVAGRPIVDKTGITGKFDIHLEFAKEPIPSGPAFLNGQPQELASPNDPHDAGAAQSLFTAIQKQLGLKLTAGTAPIDVIMVDHIDEPSPN